MGIEPAHPTIRRHFVTINGERQVHYRRAGRGPAVVLLHQSPTSSREHTRLIERLMSEFTVIAPDTPGNGLSDPLLGEQPLAEDYAHALAETLDDWLSNAAACSERIPAASRPLSSRGCTRTGLAC